jgi:hypothetical protein
MVTPTSHTVPLRIFIGLKEGSYIKARKFTPVQHIHMLALLLSSSGATEWHVADVTVLVHDFSLLSPVSL